MTEHRIAKAEDHDEILSILKHFIARNGRNWPNLLRWMWKLWRYRPGDAAAAAAFLATEQPRVVGPYLAGGRYESIFRRLVFLQRLYGTATQELRPNNYTSRHFGNSWMNVQKVLRQPPGRPQDPIIYRWYYHQIHIDRHGKLLEHLAVSLAVEELADMVRNLTGVAVVSSSGVAPLIPGEQEPNNALLDRYKKLTDPAPFRKALPPGIIWI